MDSLGREGKYTPKAPVGNWTLDVSPSFYLPNNDIGSEQAHAAVKCRICFLEVQDSTPGRFIEYPEWGLSCFSLIVQSECQERASN
jgi:hypothetical protein